MTALAVATGAAACSLYWLSPDALAAPYPPSRCAITVQDTTVIPGESLRVAGRNFAPNATISVDLLTRPTFILGAARTDARGSFVLMSVVPETAPNGTLALAATPGSSCLSTPITVTSDVHGIRAVPLASADVARTADRVSLPRATWPALAAGLTALLVAGRLAVTAMRRRRAR